MRQQLLHDNMSDDDEDKSMGGTEQILEDTGVNNSDVEPVAMNVDVDKDKEDKSMSGNSTKSEWDSSQQHRKWTNRNGGVNNNINNEDNYEDDSYHTMSNKSRSSSEDSGEYTDVEEVGDEEDSNQSSSEKDGGHEDSNRDDSSENSTDTELRTISEKEKEIVRRKRKRKEWRRRFYPNKKTREQSNQRECNIEWTTTARYNEQYILR